MDTKSEALRGDPLAICKPTGAKHVDAARAIGNFTGWTFAAVNAIASEVANIQLRLYRVNGDERTEQGNTGELQGHDTNRSVFRLARDRTDA
jgi:hypothetical protein